MLIKDQNAINALLRDYNIKMPKNPPRVLNEERFKNIMSAIDVIKTFILETSPDAIFEIRGIEQEETLSPMNPKDIYFIVITDEIIVQDTTKFFAAISHGNNFEIYSDKKSKIKLSIRFGGAFSAAPLPDPFSDK